MTACQANIFMMVTVPCGFTKGKEIPASNFPIVNFDMNVKGKPRKDDQETADIKFFYELRALENRINGIFHNHKP